MLAGAGLAGAGVTPELARDFGQILRVVVSGVMDVLQARQQIKEEFRMRMTHFRPADNNPLKFSANVEDALHNLLVKRNAAYLGPVEAFADAFEDLRNHQIAMLAGMRVAFESMLAEFDPDRLQEQFDRQLKRARCSACRPSCDTGISTATSVVIWSKTRSELPQAVRRGVRAGRTKSSSSGSRPRARRDRGEGRR